MKKKLVLLILLVVGAILFNIRKGYEDRKLLSDLTLENVEALAQGEGDNGIYYCYGFGDVDCPRTDAKVAYVVGPLR